MTFVFSAPSSSSISAEEYRSSGVQSLSGFSGGHEYSSSPRSAAASCSLSDRSSQSGQSRLIVGQSSGV